MIDQRFAPYAAALLRISLGAMWISHALLKYFVFTIGGFAGFLTTHGLPAVFAWPVFLMELIGGILIAVGIRGRLVSFALLPILIGATVVHAGNGWVFTSANGGWEYPVFLISTSIVHMLLGDGALALTSAPTFATGRLRSA